MPFGDESKQADSDGELVATPKPRGSQREVDLRKRFTSAPNQLI
jgi:hypothetical protein